MNDASVSDITAESPRHVVQRVSNAQLEMAAKAPSQYRVHSEKDFNQQMDLDEEAKQMGEMNPFLERRGTIGYAFDQDDSHGELLVARTPSASGEKDLG